MMLPPRLPDGVSRRGQESSPKALLGERRNGRSREAGASSRGAGAGSSIKNALDIQLVIAMSHTRATNEFSIEFDSVRDGFVVRMDSTRWKDGIAETVAEGVEVAFIRAWLEDDTGPFRGAE